MRKTKIVCTIGPACSDEKVLEQLCLAGMNVARFNFSHGSHESQKKLMDAVKNVRERLGLRAVEPAKPHARRAQG